MNLKVIQQMKDIQAQLPQILIALTIHLVAVNVALETHQALGGVPMVVLGLVVRRMTGHRHGDRPKVALNRVEGVP